MLMNDTERARAALQSIPPDCDRDTWVRAGMAAHAAGLDFDTFDSWSAQADNYDARAARDTWRSFKPGKGVGAGTLHRMAAEHGHRQESPSKAANRPVARPKTARHGASPADVWGRCEPATWQHPYIERKAAAGVPLENLRVVPVDDPLRIAGHPMAGALAVPAYGPTGELQSLQLIPPQGKKMNLPGAPMAGASFTVGTPDGGPLYLVEGIGQAWAIWQATGRPAVCCLGWGNVATVARQLQGELVLVPDAGKERQAETVARELGCRVAFMPEGSPGNFDASDLAQRDGADVLAALLDEARSFAPEPLLVPVDVAGVLSNPSEPPRFVWQGFCPRGEVTLLAAHGGTGKSTIALMLAVAVAAGRELFDTATERAPVVFASFEDGAGIVRHRLAHICREWDIEPRELEGLHIVDGTASPELFTSEGRGPGDVTPAYGELQALVKQTGAGLLVVDNASDVFGADEIQRRQVRAFIRSLALIARENDAAVLLLAHVDKGTSRKERNDAEGYSGSTAWHNSARSRIFMSRDDGGLLTLTHQKSNHGRMREPLTLEWPNNGLPQILRPLSPVVQGITDSNDTKALLRLIAEFSERGEPVSTATAGSVTGATMLRGERGYPKRKPAEVFALLRDAERRGYLERVEFRTRHRNVRECWSVTPEGRTFAEIPAAVNAANAAIEPFTATAAGAAPQRGEYALGGMGDCSTAAPIAALAETDTRADMAAAPTSLQEASR